MYEVVVDVDWGYGVITDAEGIKRELEGKLKGKLNFGMLWAMYTFKNKLVPYKSVFFLTHEYDFGVLRKTIMEIEGVNSVSKIGKW